MSVIVALQYRRCNKKRFDLQRTAPASDSRLILASKVKANGLFDQKNGNRVEQMGISQ
jgi:hypothetical protein